ncbi:MAG: phosphodiesterase [Micrococcales bacterium]|nr:phosphodiesterase [Micrococcales bacterium]OJX69517.1 MAG: phosphodiesterase [Micrococcales bacterium 72-143]
MVQLGQHAPPIHVIAHVSDTHLLGGGRPLYGAVDTDATVARAFAQLERSGMRPEAIVITGDLADLGEPDAYRRLKGLVEPAAERMGSRIIWVMGNHDEREPFAEILMGEQPTNATQDRVYDLGGLRVIALDSTVPGYHHGDLEPAQLEWLRAELATPAPHGTLLALHHPPIPTPVELMAILELDHQAELAEVIRGSDVRAVLAGHLHYSTTGTFAGVPVSVASATCYTIDSSAEPGTLAGVDGGQTFNLVHVYDDQVVHSIVPIGDAPRVAGFSGAFLDALAAMTPAERREAFSNKRSTFNLEEHLRSAAAAPPQPAE